MTVCVKMQQKTLVFDQDCLQFEPSSPLKELNPAFAVTFLKSSDTGHKESDTGLTQKHPAEEPDRGIPSRTKQRGCHIVSS